MGPFSGSISDRPGFVQQARDFMEFYFDGDLETAWMCCFYGDPGGKRDWTGMPAKQMLELLPAALALEANKGRPPNLYWSPYRYRGATRNSDNFLEAVAVVVDDVGPRADVELAKRLHERALQQYRAGELALWKALSADRRAPKPVPPKYRGVKIAIEDLQARLATPTTRLLTSPGNEQWFYKLTPPCRDKARLRSVLLAIGSDARDLARVMRCPGGGNWKPSAMNQQQEA